MKSMILLFCLFSLASTLFAGPDNGPPPSPIGTTARYQIVTGMQPSIDGSGTPTVFRIDTWTGETWVLSSVPMRISNGKPIGLNVWLPLHETTGNIYEIAIKSMTAPAK